MVKKMSKFNIKIEGFQYKISKFLMKFHPALFELILHSDDF